MSYVTERLLMLVVGGALVVCVVYLLMGGDLLDLVALLIAFAVGGALPSPFKRGG